MKKQENENPVTTGPVEENRSGENIHEKEPGLTPEQESGLDQLKPDYDPSKEGETTEKQPKNQQQIAMVTMMVGGIFEVLAVRLGDHWRLDQKEAVAIAKPAVMVMDKYLPDFEAGPEFALIAAVGMVVLPRVLQQKQIAEAKSDGDQSPSGSPE